MTDTPPADDVKRKSGAHAKHSKHATLTKRRELTSRLVLRGMTYDEVAEALVKQGYESSSATVTRDMKVIKATWRAATAEHYDDLVARYIAEVGEARRMAIANNDVTNWLKALALQAKALGLDAPERLSVTWQSAARDAGLTEAQAQAAHEAAVLAAAEKLRAERKATEGEAGK